MLDDGRVWLVGGASDGVKRGFLLVVALQLLGSVVAVRVTLPGAVVQSVRLGICLLVETMVPRRLTFAAQAASSERGRVGWKSELIVHAWHHVSVQVLGRNESSAIRLADHPDRRMRVRKCEAKNCR